MLKAMICAKRAPGTEVGEFLEAWRDHVAALAGQPGARRVVRNDAIPSSYDKGREPYLDGIAEVWVDDPGDVPGTPPPLSDTAAGFTLVVEEVPMKEGPVVPAVDGGVKLVQFIERGPAVDAAEFHRYWREEHGPLARGNEWLLRYVQNHVREDLHPTPPGPRHHGSPMTWFTSFDALRASGRSELLAEVQRDEANFMSNPGGRLPSVVVGEHEVT